MNPKEAAQTVDPDGVLEQMNELTQREAVGLLSVYDRAREDAKAQRLAGEQLKRYLDKHPGELEDAEHELVGRLGFRKDSDSYDVAKMPEALVLSLARLGALDLNKKMIDALEGRDASVLDAKLYKRRSVTGAQVLIVERKPR